MLSASILVSCKKLVQAHVLPLVPAVWQKQVQFGLSALALRPLVSLNSNARTVGGKRNTAEVKMTRLLHNNGLPEALGKIAVSLGFVTPTSFVNVDHTDVNGLVALVCAVQTKLGRALPVFVRTAYSGKLSARDDAPKRTKAMRKNYNKQKRKMKLTAQTICDLQAFHDLLGFWPRLVFDRGFGDGKLIRFLRRNKVTFYIRMRAGSLAELPGGVKALHDLASGDEIVTVAKCKLRVVRSQKQGRNKEPWYILTSDFKRTPRQVIKTYYHRFEIEESFRDIKSVLGLRRTKLMKPLSLAVLFWLVSLGILLLYLAGLKTYGKKAMHQMAGTGLAKKRVSWFRFLYELLEHALRQPFYEMVVGRG
jgi:hypothetical protein